MEFGNLLLMIIIVFFFFFWRMQILYLLKFIYSFIMQEEPREAVAYRKLHVVRSAPIDL